MTYLLDQKENLRPILVQKSSYRKWAIVGAVISGVARTYANLVNLHVTKTMFLFSFVVSDRFVMQSVAMKYQNLGTSIGMGCDISKKTKNKALSSRGTTET